MQTNLLGQRPIESRILASAMGWSHHDNGGFIHLQPFDDSTIGILQFEKIISKYPTPSTINYFEDEESAMRIRLNSNKRALILEEIMNKHIQP